MTRARMPDAARDRRTSCSPASCRSRSTTRSRPAASWPRSQPGARVRRRVRQLGGGRHRRRPRRRRHERRVPRQARCTRRCARWSPRRLDTAVFTHGHIDHVLRRRPLRGGGAHERLGAAARRRARGDRRPLRPLRDDRRVQRRHQPAAVPGAAGCAGRPSTATPTRRTATRSTLDVGGERFELHHDRGETDDRTWVWVAGAQGAVHRRPVHLGVAELRQPAEGAALRARLGARVPQDGRARAPRCCCPGTGCRSSAPTACARRSPTGAELLEYARSTQTLALMNEGARLDDIVHTVQPPAHLLDRPYLRPIYDEPEFVVRNIWRLYGGWYDGDPAHLKPAPAAALAGELADARRRRGTPGRAGARARGRRATCGSPATSPSWRRRPRPTTRACTRSGPRCSSARAEEEASTMAKGIFCWAAHESQRAGRDRRGQR